MDRKISMPSCFFLMLCTMTLISCGEQTKQHQIYFPKGGEQDTISFKYSNNGHIVVDIGIGRENYDFFVFDTGAPSTMIRQGILASHEENDTIRFSDINGNNHLMHGVGIDTLHIGNTMITGVKDFHRSELNFIDGFLGGNILQQLVWKIDFVNRKIYFAKDINSFAVNPAKAIPFELKNNTPFVKAHINGVASNLLIDAGNPKSFVSLSKKDYQKFNGKEEDMINWYSIRQPVSVFPSEGIKTGIDTSGYMKGNITVGDEYIADEIIIFKHYYDSQIGLDFLKRFGEVIFDYPNQKLYLCKKRKYKSLSFLFNVAKNMNNYGIQISTDSVPVVTKVSSGLKEKCIQINDTVVRIGDVNFTGRKSDFYNDTRIETLDSSGKRRIDVKLAKQKVVIDNFNYGMRNGINDSEVVIKRGDSLFTYILKRQYFFKDIPDSVQSYSYDEKDFYLVDNASIVQDSTSSSFYLYRVSKLPADILKTHE